MRLLEIFTHAGFRFTAPECNTWTARIWHRGWEGDGMFPGMGVRCPGCDARWVHKQWCPMNKGEGHE